MNITLFYTVVTTTTRITLNYVNDMIKSIILCLFYVWIKSVLSIWMFIRYTSETEAINAVNNVYTDIKGYKEGYHNVV